VSQDEPAYEARDPRQFSLGSLLWFVVLTSLWCSQIAVVREVVFGNTLILAVASVASVLMAWTLLSWFCFRQRLFGIFTLQCVVPATIAIWTLWPLFDTTTNSFRNLLGFFVVVTLCANLLSFPIAAISMAMRWAWPSAKAKRHDPAMPWWP
jgi:hypothetical protein